MATIQTFFATIVILFLSTCSPDRVIVDKKSAVVAIASEKIENSTAKSGLGTGWLLRENYIVTNYHVAGKTLSLKVVVEDSSEEYPAELVYGDELSDIAVIRLKNWGKFKSENEFQYLTLADYNDVRQGQEVWAIGHPWGLTWSISRGIVSGIARRPGDNPTFLLQTDANIFQGNSGGPLLNSMGEVIAMNSIMVADKGGSYGMAIPSVIVNKVLRDLEKHGEVRWTMMGVIVAKNAVIKEIAPDKPADNAGLQVGDKVMSIEFENRTVQIKNTDHLVMEITTSDPDSPFALNVKRGEKIIKVDVRPTFMPSSAFLEKEAKK